MQQLQPQSPGGGETPHSGTLISAPSAFSNVMPTTRPDPSLITHNDDRQSVQSDGMRPDPAPPGVGVVAVGVVAAGSFDHPGGGHGHSGS
jgi:hypothetical protein